MMFSKFAKMTMETIKHLMKIQGTGRVLRCVSLGSPSYRRLPDDFPVLRRGAVPNELAAAVVEFRHFLCTQIVHKQSLKN
jgi:hypothetical protein